MRVERILTYTIFLCFCNATGAAVVPCDTVAVGERFVEAAAAWNSAPSLSFENPALMNWRLPFTIGHVSAGYFSEDMNRPEVKEEGRGSGQGFFDAGAFVRSGNSVIYGSASYRNGRRRDVQWCETSDYRRVYPYVTADADGGPMNIEHYGFEGGYGAVSGDWSYGVCLSYEAGLYFRERDPRPRNVTGDLRIKAAGGYRVLPGYTVALSGIFGRYTQSCDIAFYNETGESKIYHLSGLGTHYVRFDGAGKDTRYKGYSCGASLDFLGTEEGAFCSAAFVRETLGQTIQDLNRLPLTDTWRNTLRLQAGWRGDFGRNRLCAVTHGEFSRLHGTENIFGDAASSVYPQIASLEMFADNAMSLGAGIVYERRFGAARLSIAPAFMYEHSRQIYALPRKLKEINILTASFEASWVSPLSSRLTGLFSAGASLRRKAGGCRLNLGEVPDTDIDRALASVVEYDYGVGCSAASEWRLSAEVLYSINMRYALSLKASWSRRGYDAVPVDADRIYVSLNFYY